MASEAAWGHSDGPAVTQGPMASSQSPTPDPPKAALHPCPAPSPVMGLPQVAEGSPAPTLWQQPLLASPEAGQLVPLGKIPVGRSQYRPVAQGDFNLPGSLR